MRRPLRATRRPTALPAEGAVLPDLIEIVKGVSVAIQRIASRNHNVEISVFTVVREDGVLAAANVAEEVPDDLRSLMCNDMRAAADATIVGDRIETIVRSPDRVTRC